MNVLAKKQDIIIDIYEHFVKQSYRSRYCIYGPNGKMSLIVPLEKWKDKTITKDIKISYSYDWQKHMWKSLEAAYRSSAFFEMYEDKFNLLFIKRFNFLIDFNEDAISLVCKLLKINANYRYSDRYMEDVNRNLDFRNYFHPKFVRSDANEYYQVFSNSHGFIQDLSVLDLIFNVGNFKGYF